MFYEKFHMLWVIVVGTPMQCSLLQHSFQKILQTRWKIIETWKLKLVKTSFKQQVNEQVLVTLQ